MCNLKPGHILSSKKIQYLLVSTVLIFVAILYHSESVYGQSDGLPIRNQAKIVLKSKVLNENRTLWIYTPTRYATSNEKYPVLYLLDPDLNFAYVTELEKFLSDRYRIPQLIIIGIVNTDRVRDFTPIHSLIYNGKVDSSLMNTGGGNNFLNFVKDEVIPYVEKNYRTQPYRILEGHSLGGLFAIYCKEAAPKLFQSEIVISPAIYGGNLQILSQFTTFLHQHTNLSGFMSLSIGDEPGGKLVVDSLIRQLKTLAPVSFKWQFTPYMNEDHFSVGYKSMYDGLRFIYSDWFMNPQDINAVKSYKDIEQHFAFLSKQYGYKITPGEDFMNDCGYQRLNGGHIEQAIEIFRENINNHPNSSNVYDSMGEAYMKNGEQELAIKNYEKSLLLNPHNNNAKEMLKKLKAATNK
jgi:predicted alpha/beta superfamily hydrolase